MYYCSVDVDACLLAMESLDHVDGGAGAVHEDVDHVPVGQHRRRGCFSSAASSGTAAIWVARCNPELLAGRAGLSLAMLTRTCSSSAEGSLPLASLPSATATGVLFMYNT